jgi:hypothetical protein
MILKQKFTLSILFILWVLTIYLMVQNYNQYPPLDPSNPLSDRINNIEGNLFKYGIISFTELILRTLLLIYFFSISLRLRLVIILYSITFVVWAYLDAMYSGGVAASHALWISVELVFVYFYLFLLSKKHRKIKHF